MMNLKVNRKYKERLFLRVFRDRKDLLSLYNAVNGTSYTDPEQLEITTIEGVIYMGKRYSLRTSCGGDSSVFDRV